MQSADLFEKIKPWWLEEVKSSLDVLTGIVAHVDEYNLKIFEGLKSWLIVSNWSSLDGIISEWTHIENEAQLNVKPVNLVNIWTNIMQASIDVAQKKLDNSESLYLISELTPGFVHAIQLASEADIKKSVFFSESELLRVRQTLERVEKSKSDFISVAAHELRTPLTLIEGYTSMIREAMPSDDSKRLQAALCLKGINAGTHRLREIVDDMIDVSMIDNNLLALNFQPIWLSKIFDSVKREFDDTITDRKLNFQIVPFAGSKDMIFGDGERLFQAFRNITANAIKYTPDGGSISIDGRSLPGFVEIVVSDTGIGIDSDQHTRIFEKFGRLGSVSLHSSGKTKFKGGGPGLGLPITKGIIEAHGGAIWVESDGFDEVKCPGSRFHVMLPIRKSPPVDRIAQFFREKM